MNFVNPGGLSFGGLIFSMGESFCVYKNRANRGYIYVLKIETDIGIVFDFPNENKKPYNPCGTEANNTFAYLIQLKKIETHENLLTCNFCCMRIAVRCM